MSRVKEIRQELVRRTPQVCAHLLPRGHPDGTNWRVGSVRGEAGSSLSVQCDKSYAGHWKDFAGDEDERGDILKLWMMVRKISFADALDEAEVWLERGAPSTPLPLAAEDSWRVEKTPYVPVAMPTEVAGEWEKGRSFLVANPPIQAALDQVRGWPLGTTAALSAWGLLACPHVNEKPHWAFPVQYPAASGCMNLGYHARPVEQIPGRKTPWMYRPNARLDRIAVPAVPFVLGSDELQNARLVVVLEGQWDAITWAAAAGWLHQWPRGITVFGLRGATSWRVFLTHWGQRWPSTAKFLLIPDGDDAGQQWRGEFASTLTRRRHTLQIMSPPAGLDFSDWQGREPFSAACIHALLQHLNLYE